MNKKLTRSSAHRADFNRRRQQANSQRQDEDLPQLKALLSGHGIRWGIRAERWERMWEVCNVGFVLYLLILSALSMKDTKCIHVLAH